MFSWVFTKLLTKLNKLSKKRFIYSSKIYSYCLFKICFVCLVDRFTLNKKKVDFIQKLFYIPIPFHDHIKVCFFDIKYTVSIQKS